MTESGIYYPELLTGPQLDLFLARGWYRMGQGIFTTHYIVQQDAMYRVYWLRYELAAVQTNKTHTRIRSLNKKFTVTHQPLEITDELETLYQDYRSGINFQPADSVQHWLYDEHTRNIYDTMLVEIRDEGRLIAAGIYDRGDNSMAGIMNFYHPDYKKYSPGKYLMLLKMDEAKRSGMQWYYPGYIVYGYPKFDYKLFVDKTAADIFIPELNQWYRYNPLLLDVVAKAGTLPKDEDETSEN
jgi:leucyl-tRNA---protein transferase